MVDAYDIYAMHNPSVLPRTALLDLFKRAGLEDTPAYQATVAQIPQGCLVTPAIPGLRC